MAETRNNSGEFLATYNEIDEFMRRRLSADDTVPHKRMIELLMKKDRVINKHRDDLFDFARLRNAIVHNPYGSHADPIAEPHDYVVAKYKKIKNEIINPVKVIDIAIKGSSIYCTALNDNAFKVMKSMKENAYTHVPVLKNGSVIGVFSLFTVFAYLIEKGCVQISGDTKVGDLAEYITFEGHQGEYFKFVPKDCPVIDIEDLFAKRLQDNKRLVTIFITEHGEPDEKLLGIVSAWDVASRR